MESRKDGLINDSKLSSSPSNSDFNDSISFTSFQSLSNTKENEPPVSYLQLFPSQGFLICTYHQSAYTLQNYQEHLRRLHYPSRSLKKQIIRWIAASNVAETVIQPQHHRARFAALPVLTAWQCQAPRCDYITTSRQRRFQHQSSKHGLNSKRKQREAECDREIQVQTLFVKTRRYFIIDPAKPPQIGEPIDSPNDTNNDKINPNTHNPSNENSNIDDEKTPLCDVSQRFYNVFRQQYERYRRITEPEHPSELTPWLRRSRFHEHVLDLDPESFRGSYIVPREEDNLILYHVAQSVHRVLRKAIQQIQHLHHTDAMMLNSFQVNTVSQDPFQYLQEGQSIDLYIRTFCNLICYFWRVLDNYFERIMFVVTEEQRSARDGLKEAVNRLITQSDRVTNPEDKRIIEQEKVVDQHLLQLAVTLIQHRTPQSVFDNAIISFLAVFCWSTSEQAWMSGSECSTIFSRLIYGVQLILLLEAFRLVEQKEFLEVGDAIETLGHAWLINTTKGPMSTLLALRLYAMAIGRNTVTASQIRWHQDGQTLQYRGIEYQIGFLAEETNFYLEHAQTIFERDLCLELPNLPQYHPRELEDNWDAGQPGLSFIDDPRNEAALEGGREWLFQQVCRNPRLQQMVFEDQSTHVRPSFAREFEKSVQRFLEYLLMLMHKTSGQPARKPEFLGLRWRNKGYDKRNVFLHDGYVLFLLTYHKSLSRVHASRYPVRFLLPEVGRLLIQYLVLIQPFRQWLSAEVQIPFQVTEYLWSDQNGIWIEQKMTRIMKSLSQQAVGVEVHVQAWRQIAVAISMKKFSGQRYEADLDLPGDLDDDNGGLLLTTMEGGLPDVFHHQSTHAPLRGNLSYGGTVNFNQGLTDAGLQEYHIASQLWHRLCRASPSSQTGQTGQTTSSRRRRANTSLNPPLIKRVTIRQQPPRHKRRWGAAEVRLALQRLYPDQEHPSFKTKKQQEMVETIASGLAEIVVVLATGEGKSLAFLVPICLPQAATTVVILPLVALKQDMVRRCQLAKIAHSVWDPHGDFQHYIGTPLLFVSVESAVRPKFRRFLGQLDASQGLDRVIFDESHLAITASTYRPKMALVKYLRQFHCQLVCLTATLPPSMELEFQRRFLLARPGMIRGRTFRKDLCYRVKYVPKSESLLKWVAYCVRESMKSLQGGEEAGRIIVYVQSRDEADSLQEALQCPVYYSDSGDEDEKARAAQQWREGREEMDRVIVATSAFGLGVDYSAVREVFHAGAPRDLVSFSQEVGRSGRDGHGGTSYVLLPHPPLSISAIEKSSWQPCRSSSEQAIDLYLGENRCLGAVLSCCLDGRDSIEYCQASEALERCTNCQQYGIFDPGREADPTRYGDETTESASESMVEDDGDSPSEDSLDSQIRQGGQRLRQHLRDEGFGRDRYVQRLRAIQGRCLVCTLLPGTGTGNEWHVLDQCRNAKKWDFVRAKKAALDRGRRRGLGWIKAYTACFQCGHPQVICEEWSEVDAETGRSKKGCQFGDMVFPAAWALYRMENRWGYGLTEVTGQQMKGIKEEQWMDWCGQETELYGMRACQGAKVLEWILGKVIDETVTT